MAAKAASLDWDAVLIAAKGVVDQAVATTTSIATWKMTLGWSARWASWTALEQKLKAHKAELLRYEESFNDYDFELKSKQQEEKDFTGGSGRCERVIAWHWGHRMCGQEYHRGSIKQDYA